MNLRFPSCSRLVVVILTGAFAITLPEVASAWEEAPIGNPPGAFEEEILLPIEPAPATAAEKTTTDEIAMPRQEPESAQSASSPWHPPVPAPDGYDWIRLTSGEWLKGDIKALRDERLEFESDELDDLTFDWEDVAELRSPRLHTYVFEDRSVVYGTALIRDNRVLLSLAGQEQEFKRSRLMSIVSGGKRRRDYWSGKGSVGLSFRHGNTEQTDLTYQGFLRRQSPLTRARLDYNGSIGQQDGTQNVNDHRGNLKLDIFLSPRFYVTPLVVEAIHDRYKNVDLRLKPGIGAGYTVIDKRRIECDLELAGGYQYVRYGSVVPGEDAEEGAVVMLPTVRLETDITSWLDFDVLYTISIGVTDLDDTTQHAELILSVEITQAIDLDVTWMWDRVTSPVPNEDGTIPENDDIQLTVGLGLNF